MEGVRKRGREERDRDGGEDCIGPGGLLWVTVTPLRMRFRAEERHGPSGYHIEKSSQGRVGVRDQLGGCGSEPGES